MTSLSRADQRQRWTYGLQPLAPPTSSNAAPLAKPPKQDSKVGKGAALRSAPALANSAPSCCRSSQVRCRRNSSCEGCGGGGAVMSTPTSLSSRLFPDGGFVRCFRSVCTTRVGGGGGGGSLGDALARGEVRR